MLLVVIAITCGGCCPCPFSVLVAAKSSVGGGGCHREEGREDSTTQGKGSRMFWSRFMEAKAKAATAKGSKRNHHHHKFSFECILCLYIRRKNQQHVQTHLGAGVDLKQHSCKFGRVAFSD